MPSNITYLTIDEAFPRPGIDNSSQGFRDNFTIIKESLRSAKTEIDDLYANSILANNYNEFKNGTIANVALKNYMESVYDLGDVSGTLTFNAATSSYQRVRLTGTVNLSITGVRNPANRRQKLTLEVVVTNPTYEIDVPGSIDISTIASNSGDSIQFSNPGTYYINFYTSNGGTNWTARDESRGYNQWQGNINITGANANTYSTLGGLTTTLEGNLYSTFTANALVCNVLTVYNGQTINSQSATYSGNVTANNLIANTGIYGNIRTNVQTNIQTLGTLTGLTVNGNTSIGLTSNANVTFTSYGWTDICGPLMTGIYFANVAANGILNTNLYRVPMYVMNPVANLTSNITSTIASATISLPTDPKDGQRINFAFAGTVTTLTMSPAAGHSINAPLVTGNTAQGGTWVFYSNVWYRAG